MKTLFTLLLVLAYPLIINPQNDLPDGLKRAGKVYSTFEDYKADKPIPGLLVEYNTYKKLVFSKNGEKVKLKKLNLNSVWFYTTYHELERYFDGEAFNVNYIGKLSIYGGFCYSETPDGELKKGNKNMFNEYLKKYGLKEMYDSDKGYTRAKGRLCGCNE